MTHLTHVVRDFFNPEEFVVILRPSTLPIQVNLFKFHVQVQQIDRLEFSVSLLHSLHYLQHFLLMLKVFYPESCTTIL